MKKYFLLASCIFFSAQAFCAPYTLAYLKTAREVTLSPGETFTVEISAPLTDLFKKQPPVEFHLIDATEISALKNPAYTYDLPNRILRVSHPKLGKEFPKFKNYTKFSIRLRMQYEKNSVIFTTMPSDIHIRKPASHEALTDVVVIPNQAAPASLPAVEEDEETSAAELSAEKDSLLSDEWVKLEPACHQDN